MQLSEHLKIQYTFLNEQLDYLLKNYTTLDDTIRIETSKRIFDLLRRVIQTDVNVIYPRATTVNSLSSVVPRGKHRHQMIEDQIEKILMIHVDEPEDMYINEMITLRDMVSTFEAEDTHILDTLDETLSDKDKETIHHQLSISLSEAQPVG